MLRVFWWLPYAIWDILQWTPLLLSCQIYWSLAAHWDLCTHLQVSSSLLGGKLVLHLLLFSKSKVHLHLWWNKKPPSFRFSWAITKTCCPLLGIPLAFLPPGFLGTLFMSFTFLSVMILSLSGLSSLCSLMSNLAPLGLNPIQIYISWSFEAIFSGTPALCTCSFPLYCSWGIIIWLRVPSWGMSTFAYSASGLTSLSTWKTGKTSGSEPS